MLREFWIHVLLDVASTAQGGWWQPDGFSMAKNSIIRIFLNNNAIYMGDEPVNISPVTKPVDVWHLNQGQTPHKIG